MVTCPLLDPRKRCLSLRARLRTVDESRGGGVSVATHRLVDVSHTC